MEVWLKNSQKKFSEKNESRCRGPWQKIDFFVKYSPVNKSKEDFIWFIKKATSNRKSDAHSELYHALLKMFVDADTNYDGLVSRESFSKLVDKAASIPRAYGYAPPDSEL